MKLTRLKLQNFRGFEALDLEFDPRLTVLVGVNGSGKSSVLEAICVPLSAIYADQIANLDDELRRIYGSDRRRGSDAPRYVRLEYRDGDFPGARSVGSDVGGGRPENLTCLQTPRHGFTLPLYIPTARDVTHSNERRPAEGERSGWREALSGSFKRSRARYSPFFDWYERRENAENAARLSQAASDFRDLEAVRAAIGCFVDGVTDVRMVHPGVYPDDPLFNRITQPVLSVTKNGDLLLFDQLSDGERALFAMVGDLARRLAIANPTGDPLQGEAIVLIDEIELHLHPDWQRKVLPRLLTTFPNTQFVVTTHSPQVVSGVKREQLRILEGFQLVAANPHVEGRDSNSILYEVFGVSRRPTETTDALREIGLQLEREDYDAARASLDALARRLGDDDLEIVRARRLLGAAK